MGDNKTLSDLLIALALPWILSRETLSLWYVLLALDTRCCRGKAAGEEVGMRAKISVLVCLLTTRVARRELDEFTGDEAWRGDARAVVAGEMFVRARKEAAWTATRMARAIEDMILNVWVKGREELLLGENAERKMRWWWFQRKSDYATDASKSLSAKPRTAKVPQEIL
ncbi:hypothetical protein DFH08DRAFT_483030 [Mycena albidolilacea]|uniref:Uncharacterized protein n=1 Tax=Mycena albidolilacea TaxID=1033008 RepID=A0AAD7AFX7_9AGAR|nr:hypothetical protein DFH08DRAFT_483030 [Mycena albidolilacea]